MLQLINQVLTDDCLTDYPTPEAFRAFCREMGIDGGEGIWGGVDIPAPFFDNALFPGYHLRFFADWADFWMENKEKLDEKFRGRQVWQDFFQGTCQADMLRQFQEDVDRAAELGVQYVVFHVSDVDVNETYGRYTLHSDEEIIDCAADCINKLLDGKGYTFDFLMENLWWPGLTMADPTMTKRLLDQVHYPKKGLMLDTGHLMNTNLDLYTEDQGINYVLDRVNAHGDMAECIKGIHLHRSLSSAFVREDLKQPMPELPDDYLERWRISYERLLKIDLHMPFKNPRVKEIVERVKPKYLVHELSGSGAEKKEKLRTQMVHFKGYKPAW